MKNYPNPLHRHQWEYKGFQCEVKRGVLWNWNGYVKVGRDHPDFGKDADELQAIAIHGGIAYSREDGLIGFDHAHVTRDRIPGYSHMETLGRGLPYTSMDQVKAEVERLADQLFVRQNRMDVAK